MEWESRGIILANKNFGENKLITTVFTKNFGLKRGLCRKNRSFSVGNIVHCRWGARLESHLGNIKTEIIEEICSFVIFCAEKLKIFNAVIATLLKVLPENEVKIELYAAFEFFLKSIKSPDHNIYAEFIKFDLLLLKELGFELELSRCTVTGSTEDLFYISPKTGKAVCKKSGQDYHTRLIKMPRFLSHLSTQKNKDLCKEEYFLHKEGFIECAKVTNYFFKRFVFTPLGISFPHFRESVMEF